MRYSHIIARIGQQYELFNLISYSYDRLVEVELDNLTILRIKTRIDSLDETWQRFSVTHDAISIAISDLSQEEASKVKVHSYFTENLFSVAHESYLSNVEKMRLLLDSHSEPGTTQEMAAQQSSNTTSTITTTCFHQARLPRIDLPKFNGNPSEWLSFKDLFNSLVLSNPTLTEVGRLQYLKTSLVGSAAQLLKNTTLTADNFQKAWDALIAFYENKRLLVNTALHSLLNIKRMSKESAMELEQLYTNIMQIYRSFETLQRPVAYWDDFLVFVATQRLDADSVKAWEQQLGPTRDPPTWTQFSNFLITRLRSLQAFENSRAGKQTTQTTFKSSRSCYHGKSKESKSIDTANCIVCTEKHYTTACPQYSTKTRNQKLAIINKHRLCFNCLGPHRVAQCISTRRCKRCGKRHHTSIHQDAMKEAKANTEPHKSFPENLKSSNDVTSAQSTSEARVLHSNVHPRASQPQILLATAQIIVLSPDGNSTRARALLDQGSEISLITERLTQRLKLPRLRLSVTFVGLGAQSSNKSKGFVHFVIKPYFPSDFENTMSAHVLSSLTTSLPSSDISAKSWSHLEGLQLADPRFMSPGDIDIIIGADIYGQIIKDGIIKGPVDTPIAQSTNLGWIISGPTKTDSSQLQFRSYHVSYDGELCKLLQRSWELESVPTIPQTT